MAEGRTMSFQNIIKKGIELGLIVFAAGSPFSISLAQIGLGIALLLWLVRTVFVRDQAWKGTFIDLYLGLFLLGIILSTIMSIDPFRVLQSNKNLWILTLMFLLVNNIDLAFARRLLTVLVAASVLSGLYGLVQSVTGWDLWHHARLGMYSRTIYGAVGGFGLHLTYGGYQMMIALILLSVSFFGLKSFSRRNQVLIVLSTLIVSLSVVVSFARTSWLGFAAGLFSLGVAGLFIKNRKVFIVILIIFLLAGVFFIQSDALRNRFLSIFSDLKHSDRTELWGGALEIIRDHPLFGIGSGLFKDYFIKYRPDHKGAFGHPHNDLLSIYTRSGLVGFIGWVLLFLVFIKRSMVVSLKLYPYQPVDSSVLLGVAVSVIAFLVAGLGQNFFSAAINGMLLWFLLGAAMVYHRHYALTRSGQGNL
jgi:O-antigen ligase